MSNDFPFSTSEGRDVLGFCHYPYLTFGSLAAQNALLHASLDPQTPSAPVTLVGPAAPHALSFSDLLRIKWNQAIERTVVSARDTDWNGVAAGVVEAGRDVSRKLSGDAQDAAHEAQRMAEEAKRAMQQDVENTTGSGVRRIFQVVEKPDSPGAWALRDGAGVGPGVEETGADLREGAAHLAHELGRQSRELGREVRHASHDLAHDAEHKASNWSKAAGAWFRRTKDEAKEVSNAAMDHLTEAGEAGSVTGRSDVAHTAASAWQDVKQKASEAVKQVTTGDAHVVADSRNLRGETFTGGSGTTVRAKREYERTALGRLV